MDRSFKDFLREKGAKFVHIKKTAIKGFEGVEFAKSKGAPSMGICFFSETLRKEGMPKTDAELAARADEFWVYDTTTASGVAGHTLGKKPAEFVVDEGVEIEL